jgi:hypothetical protein
MILITALLPQKGTVESCTLKHLAREKIVNFAVNFVKK